MSKDYGMYENQSISAVKDCMDDLGIIRNDTRLFKTIAEIQNGNQIGDIDITFNSNWQNGDGPFIQTCDTIRGYGIMFDEFKPRWQKIDYDKESKTLYIKGNGYSFSLQF
jgi:hypothetical protein